MSPDCLLLFNQPRSCCKACCNGKHDGISQKTRLSYYTPMCGLTRERQREIEPGSSCKDPYQR